MISIPGCMEVGCGENTTLHMLRDTTSSAKPFCISALQAWKRAFVPLQVNTVNAATISKKWILEAK